MHDGKLTVGFPATTQWVLEMKKQPSLLYQFRLGLVSFGRYASVVYLYISIHMCNPSFFMSLCIEERVTQSTLSHKKKKSKIR